MAKLTARFEMEDRVSKKIRKIQNGFRALEKYRKMMKRKNSIDIRKESKFVLKTIDRIQKSMKTKLGAQIISITAEDGASAVIQQVQVQLAGLPASLSIKIGASDHATKKFERLRETVAGFKGFTIRLSADDQVTPAIQKIKRYMQTALKNGYSVTIRVIDHVMKTVGRISAGIDALTGKDNSIELTINEKVLEKLASLQKKIAEIGNIAPAAKGASPAAGTGGNASEIAIKFDPGTILTELDKFAESFMGKVDEIATKFSPETILTELDKFTTSFMSKVDEIATKFSPETILTELDKFTTSFMSKVDEIATKFSPETILTELDKFTTSFMGKVDEIATKFSPETILTELDKFTTSFMGKVDEIATKFSPETILKELDKFTSSFMGKVDEIASKFSPETILKELDKFTSSFMGKVDEIASKFSPETILKELDKFTDSFMKKVDDVASKFSPETILKELDKFTDSFMKKVDDVVSKFSPDAIITRAEEFVTNIIDKVSEKFNFLNPDKIIEKAEKFVDKIVDKIAKKFEKLSPDKIIEKVGEFFEKIIKGIAEKLGNIGIGGLLGGKNKSKESKGKKKATKESSNTNVANRPAANKKTVSSHSKTKKSGGKWSGAGGCCCAGISAGKSKKVKNRNGSTTNSPAAKGNKTNPENNPKSPKGSSGKGFSDLFKTLGDSKGLKGGLKGVKGAAKGIPGLGTILSLTDLAGINKDNAGEKIGSASGGMAGAAAGAAIGSVVPGVGTLIGGAVGGIAGSLGGSSLGESFDSGALKDTWNSITEGAQSAWSTVQDTWNSVSAWFMDTVWTPISSAVVGVATSIWSNIVNAWTTIQTIFSTVATWFMDNVWTPVSSAVIGVATSIWSSIVSAWTTIKTIFSTVATWFMDNVWTPVSSAVAGVAITIWSKIVNAWTTIKNVFSTVASWFMSTVWEPVKSAVIGAATTIWSKMTGAWDKIKSVFSAVSGWFMDTVWNPVKNTVLDVGKGISNAFQTALDAVKNIWKGLSGWFVKHIQEPLTKVGDTIAGAFSKAFGWVKKIWDKAGGVATSIINFVTGGGDVDDYKGEDPDKNATGGYITKPIVSWVGEAGNEFVIPVQNNRGRGKMLLGQAASKLGMRVVDDMGAASASSGNTPSVPGGTAAGGSMSASISPSVDASNLNGQVSSLGQQFSKSFDSGINNQTVNMEDWKKKNIGTPFNNLISSSPNYGKQVVTGYAKGQNTTATGTDGFLQSKVKTPYQATVNKSSSWGTGTVKGFASGQNSSQTGTAQYVSTHVDKPFLRSKETSNSWGSGLVGNFVSGMTSKASEVKQAAKDMAKKVEEAFREELDIHSPSRVMMSLGRFASVGVVKGLGSVDVKKFAENQAGSLAAAFSGMGAVSGNVKEWLLAAMSATNTPFSWLPGLMTIAQNESGGNPNAINLWDSNAKAGHPSQGLMQTILTTFNDHKAPGMNDILNPIHNAAAAIGYIKSRYGSINNVPGIKSMNKGGPYVGYANGGLITNEQIARVGEGNKREWIIPEERGIRGRYLLQKAAQALGMEVSDPSENKQDELSSGTVAAVTSGGRQTVQTVGTKEIKIEFNGDQHFHNGQDADSLAAKIKQALLDELQKDINTGAKGVVAFD
ncbi:transglycosylase SLT domain-containing protein [Bacillus atrophaeus]|uniref:transglycosylase SLT domain-containing protein n=1 Tax=Bacillus atrophaeus TaxID=1452 RepID=UPI00227FB96C|nr:transglycosylase SLT domain-containing protein [Bacillus atrophaeus]MCY8496014.1 transglycosylase SLT domain-containing protein [Bacillus atrophaeus]MCY8833875.1 transglycosylase SLT domain-containing protein [Bacillus atrophaeus]MEC0750584.1 transglycosylase SLT domain-containing protein [Bacillus atrophaeus]MEC0800619.1 transglycosylase SLT domain-containing protein [Bacillus atrophaeus]MEC0813689.1 transglycosylase SLT domain-containing protein [Bacillus atrophaeus]